MKYTIESNYREILDRLLPNFQLNEAIDIQECITKTNVLEEIATVIEEFLTTNQFAIKTEEKIFVNLNGIALKNSGSLQNFESVEKQPHNFIIVDDDKINNFVCKSIIQRLLPGSTISMFSDPISALKFIAKNYPIVNIENTILLVDVYMPELSGWEFLDELNKFPEKIKKCFTVYLVSATVILGYKENLPYYPMISGYFLKPLTGFHIKSMNVKGLPNP